MQAPARRTRRFIAYWTMTQITLIVLRTLLSGIGVFPDLPPQASALLMIVVPSLVAIIATFIGGETYSDHSERKNATKD